MTDKSFCPAVKDLLPLYEDGALSRETEELVSGHLRQCGACRAYYEEMKGEEPNREDAVPTDCKAHPSQTLRGRRSCPFIMYGYFYCNNQHVSESHCLRGLHGAHSQRPGDLYHE